MESGKTEENVPDSKIHNHAKINFWLGHSGNDFMKSKNDGLGGTNPGFHQIEKADRGIWLLRFPASAFHKLIRFHFLAI